MTITWVCVYRVHIKLTKMMIKTTMLCTVLYCDNTIVYYNNNFIIIVQSNHYILWYTFSLHAGQ